MNHNELRAAALAATPGPWVAHSTGPGMNYVDAPESGWAITSVVPVSTWNNARYIAVANPATVLALLDEIEGLRATLLGVIQNPAHGRCESPTVTNGCHVCRARHLLGFSGT